MPPTLWEQMSSFFLSAFQFPGLDWPLVLLAIALGIAFGAIWLIAYRPPLRDALALLAVAGSSALLAWAAIAFVQVPLQVWWNEALLLDLGSADGPTLAIGGRCADRPDQRPHPEGAKLVPVVVRRARKRSTFDARTGLIVGAVAGAGSASFEAIWVHNTTFASGVRVARESASLLYFRSPRGSSPSASTSRSRLSPGTGWPRVRTRAGSSTSSPRACTGWRLCGPPRSGRHRRRRGNPCVHRHPYDSGTHWRRLVAAGE